LSLWTEVRRDFPAVSRHVYLNAAAASPTPRPVREAVTAFYRQLEEDGDGHWDEWLARREQVRAVVARFIHAEPDEITFTPNTSAGINLIVDLLEKDGDVLAADLEFPTVTLPWIHRGVRVHLLPARDGIVSPAAFAEASAPGAATIAVSHVQFSNGCRQDLDAFGALKGERRLVACGSQALGAFPLDVRGSGIDAFATGGHKWLCAGYGAGFAYLSRALLRRAPREMGWLSVEDPYAFDNRRYTLVPGARRSELGCPPFGPIFGLGAAIEYLSGLGTEAIAARVLELNAYLTARVEDAGLRVLSPSGAHRSGQTLVAIADPPRAVAFLQSRGVLVTEKPQGLRISTHFYNTEEDVDKGVAALRDYARG
jgi:cysteine desulfurase / selenocysteine lyase